MTGAARRSHLDPLEDRAEPDQLPVGVEVEQLVGQRLGARDLGEPGQQEDRIAAAPTSAVARRRSSASSGAWRCSVPPRWSRQTAQR